jgi:hypothetical protein
LDLVVRGIYGTNRSRSVVVDVLENDTRIGFETLRQNRRGDAMFIYGVRAAIPKDSKSKKEKVTISYWADDYYVSYVPRNHF